MNDVKNVTVGKPRVTGAIFRAPLGTAVPTDAKSTLSEAYKGLGYVSDDGVSNENSANSETTKAWGGKVVLETQTEKPDRYKFTLIEAMNTEVLKMVYGNNNVIGDLDTGIVIKANEEEQEESVLIIDMVLRGGILKRIVIPDGKVTEVGEVTYNDSDPVGYETTVSCMPDDAGNTHYEYIVKPDGSAVVGETEDTGGTESDGGETDGTDGNNEPTGDGTDTGETGDSTDPYGDGTGIEGDGA